MAHVSYLRRIEQLEAEAAAREPSDDDDVTARVGTRLEQMKREQEAYEALPTDEKITALEKQMAELPPDPIWYDYCRRSLEIDVLELRGASAELLQLAREQATDAVRFRRAMPTIPSQQEVDALIEAQRPACERTAASAESPRRRAEVIQLADRRPRDVLADYRGRQQHPTEPEFC